MKNYVRKTDVKLPKIRRAQQEEGEMLDYANQIQEVRKQRYALQQQVARQNVQIEEETQKLRELEEQYKHQQSKFSHQESPSQAVIDSLVRQLRQFECENQALFGKLQDVKNSQNYQYKENAEQQLKQVVDDLKAQIEKNKELTAQHENLLFDNYRMKQDGLGKYIQPQKQSSSNEDITLKASTSDQQQNMQYSGIGSTEERELLSYSVKDSDSAATELKSSSLKISQNSEKK